MGARGLLAVAGAGGRAPFGIKVTIVEPGGFSTDWVGSAQQADRLPAYAAEHAKFERAPHPADDADGPAEAAGSALLRVVDSADPPLRVFFGEAPLGVATAEYRGRLALWEQWQPVAVAAQG